MVLDNKQLVKQYLDYIKNAGYKYSKDSLGFYFDNNLRRFSVMKTGPTFQCFLNIRVESGWQLKTKSQAGIVEFYQCLIWINNCIQKQI
jgi:hypothetical protein